jgi:cytochrome c oxidase cbb3-type subunit 2
LAVRLRRETSPIKRRNFSARNAQGPDLTNIGVRQPSAVWQYIHLYNPRAVVPESVMPSFDWMFEVVDHAPPGVAPVALPKAYAPVHGVVVPTREAQALLAYLLSLKQPRLPGEVDESGSTRPPQAGTTANPPIAASTAAAGGASAAVAISGGAGGYDAAKAQALFTANCAACHQASGEGIPGAFPPLKGNAAVNDVDATTHIRVVLHGMQGGNVGGVAYSSPMPSFANTLSNADIANIIGYERSSWGNRGVPVTAQQVAAERAKGK